MLGKLTTALPMLAAMLIMLAACYFYLVMLFCTRRIILSASEQRLAAD